MYRIAIVEDEEKQVHTLTQFLRQYEKEKLVDFQLDFYSDGDEIVEKYDCNYDLILMDIMMQFMDGMTAAEEIRKKDESVFIIFITNMVNYAIRGYQVGAFDYILKPIQYFQLEKSLTRALDKLDKDDTSSNINIKTNNGAQKIPLNELKMISSYGHYLTFVATRGEYTSYMRVKDLENLLKGKDFYRVNKGTIVNLRYVDGIEDNCCLIGENRINISRGRKKEFMETLTYYMYNHS
ncbi:MAG: response regulator transcription factor [Pseudobutyrivibrio sp.]|nr:response regulator transcription factor [Pseudobutyrivibrio sp.]